MEEDWNKFMANYKKLPRRLSSVCCGRAMEVEALEPGITPRDRKSGVVARAILKCSICGERCAGNE